MPLPLFFIDTYEQGNALTLNEDTSRHVVQVLRMETGEPLQLTDGRGNLLDVTIAGEHKKKCSVTITKRQFIPQAVRRLCIGISLLKNAARFEWFLEKATEIGVTEIVPLRCDRTEKQHFRWERMNSVITAAMLQSQQYWLPVLHQPTEYNAIVSHSNYAAKCIAHCEPQQKQSLSDFAGNSSMQILIGPEGDFSPEETRLALSHNFKPVTLGSTRLRTETAGVVAAALLQQVL